MTGPTMKHWSFPGGLHLPGQKDLSTGQAIADAGIPDQLILPLQQHIGEAGDVIVHAGEQVLGGQMLAHAHGYVSVPLHAPTSGTIEAIEERAVPHPSGLKAHCIILKPDGQDKHVTYEGIQQYKELDPSALRNRIREAGIVGLGGAGFPSFIKLNPGARTAIDTLIINAAECEPYITCDDMLMRGHAADILQGIEIMQHALNARQCIIGIEDNKPEAFSALQAALDKTGADTIQLTQIPTIYPTGGEKQLIKVLTGKETPSKGLPLDIGIVCHNIATAYAIYQAIFHGRPLIDRIVTVTGKGIKQPRNLRALVGTPVSALIEQCGGYQDQVSELLMGGPMMGFNLQTDEVPVIKTSNCFLALQASETSGQQSAMPCIRCGACMDVCPAQLLPQQMYWHAMSRDLDKIQDLNLFDCIECGCCAYVCPSQIPLVQYYRFAKTEIWAEERDRKKSDIARERHEFRIERLERDKREREERMAKKRAALQKKTGDKKDSKKEAIEAALARVRDKQQQKPAATKNTRDLTEEQQRKIAEVDARRAKTTSQPEQKQTNNDEQDPA